MALFGRSKEGKPLLDGLKMLPGAAGALREAGLRPTGTASVCVKPVEGGVVGGSSSFHTSTDEFGYTWLTGRFSTDETTRMIDELHALVVTAENAGFGSALLCALIPFTDGKSTVGLIYRFMRGTWYPFVPTGKDQRDNVRELQLRTQLGNDLDIEKDLTRWSPVWGAPGL
jgi:hypothetical protein